MVMKFFYFDFAEKIMLFFIFLHIWTLYRKVPKIHFKKGGQGVQRPLKKHPVTEILIRCPFCNHWSILIKKRHSVSFRGRLFNFLWPRGSISVCFSDCFSELCKKWPETQYLRRYSLKKHDFSSKIEIKKVHSHDPPILLRFLNP